MMNNPGGYERPLGDENAGRRRVTHVVDQYLRAIDLCHASGVRVRQQGKTPDGEKGGGDVCNIGHSLASTGMTGFRGACPPLRSSSGRLHLGWRSDRTSTEATIRQIHRSWRFSSDPWRHGIRDSSRAFCHLLPSGMKSSRIPEGFPTNRHGTRAFRSPHL